MNFGKESSLKTSWKLRVLSALLVGIASVLPASAQRIGIGDVINIIGSSRGGRAPVVSNRGSNNTAAIIGIGSILYDISRSGQRQPYQTYPGSDPRYPSTYPGVPYPGSQYPGGYPSVDGRPDGYSYIQNDGLPIRLDPRILPLTINAGGGQGDQVAGRAISLWNNAGVGQVFALSNGAADLHIDWGGAKVSSGARAETRMIRSRGAMVPTDLSVRTNGRSTEQVARVVAHELGHVLGLDHSRYREDVMYEAEQNGPVALTQRDLAMTHWLYSQPRFSPIVGRTDLQGQGTPSLATYWSGQSFGQPQTVDGSGQPVCTIHQH